MKEITSMGILVMLYLLMIVYAIVLWNNPENNRDGVWTYICITFIFISFTIGAFMGEYKMKKKLEKRPT